MAILVGKRGLIFTRFNSKKSLVPLRSQTYGRGYGMSSKYKYTNRQKLRRIWM